MGNVLQIRVTSWTWNEDLVTETWPKLSTLAFSVPIHLEHHGVLEMVKALGDGLQFMKWSKERQEALEPGIKTCVNLKRRIEQELADWHPREANALSDQLEDELDKLENAFK